ncbi:hypothetical protein [Pedobacter sp. BMA]|uniref:hypothetical protein n=1 Tax=Pedobacter sp. BMA TaxID=1663685 RepID=UPI00064A9EE7|nr:hypothetical protein [Pedobacter sp. BMA]KLT63751.1 hypothetical protein AB669_20085 [Pedobacter sp. BMA]
MIDVTTRVLDELNAIPGTTSRPGLSRFDEARFFIEAFCGRYIPDDYERATQMTNDELWEYWITVDKRSMEFEFDKQEKELLFIECEDNSVNEQTLNVVNYIADPDFKTVVLEREGDVYPKLIVLSIPNLLNISDYTDAGGIPFHVYFHPTLGQNIASHYTAVNEPGRASLKDTVDNHFMPYGWDFLFFIGLKNMTYRTSTNLDVNGKVDVWAGKGLLYQINNSGKYLPNVIPILDPTRNAGDFEDPQLLLQILKELQQFIILHNGFESPELLPVGKSAISAFSSGHICFNHLLQHATNTDLGEFFGDTLQEVYMFDAPKDTNTSWVANAHAWATTYGDDKVIRGYSQWDPNNTSLLLARGQSIMQGKNIINSDNPNRSFALIGQSFFTDILASADWQSIHQAIPSLMLYDALTKSQFTV